MALNDLAIRNAKLGAKFFASLVLVTVSSSPIAAKTSSTNDSPATTAEGPCPIGCSDKDGQRLQSAFQSENTRPHQKTKMLEIVRRHTSGSTTFWSAAASDYFTWRNTDEKRYPKTFTFSKVSLTNDSAASSSQPEPSPIVTRSIAPSNSDAPPVQRDYAAERAEFAKKLTDARKGDAASFISLAGHYIAGRGVTKDYSKALFWLKKAESLKTPAAFLELSYLYLNGFGVSQDFQKSYDYARLFRNADTSEPPLTFLMRSLEGRIGKNALKCLEYGFVYRTPQFAQCNLQLDQAQQQALLLNQQTEITRQQFEFEQARFAKQQEEARLATELAKKEAEEQERRARSDKLLEMAADFACPKEGPGIFAEPVAGCGRNKNKPKAPVVNVFVQPETKYCGATAAGPIRC